VNVSEELYDPVAALRAAGIDYHRVPCWDMRAPTLEAADEGVRFIAGHVDQGHAVHIHCASGVGRSVVLTLCYLAVHEGLDAVEGLARLRRLRRRVSLRAAQREFVDRYVAWRRERGMRG
jgi:protein-tyrosine phosphatase